MKTLTGMYKLGLLNKIAVVSIVLLSGCGGGSGSSSSSPANQNSNLSSASMTIEVFEKASLTLAVSEQEYGQPGDTINLFAYTYETETEIPVSDGSIEFSTEFRADDGTIVAIPIGSAPLINGQAAIAWTTPIDKFGKFNIKARYSGGMGIAPSEWQFFQYVAAANDKDAVVYAMARLNHIVNLMKDSTTVGSVLEDGPNRPLSEILTQEFGLEILETYYRLEGGGESFTIYNDLETFVSLQSDIQKTSEPQCVRTTFIIAANDDVLLLVIKGTDGAFNDKVNDEGSPARLTLSNNIAVHPGWAWMTNKLISGFAPGSCPGLSSTGAPYFPGFIELVSQYRQNASGKNRKLYITGHSLGGALARMSMLSLAENGITMPRDRVYTFGAPRQGAYNTFEPIALDPFEGYANSVFNNNDLELTVVEGNKDPVPPLPDDTAKKSWDDSVSTLEAVLGYLRKACGVLNNISSFFEAGDVCDENISIRRPVGFSLPAWWETESFRSNSHHRKFLNGDLAFKRCEKTSEDFKCTEVTNIVCLSFGTTCDYAFHKTDVSGVDDAFLQRYHWVGDYEYNSKVRLRGDLNPTTKKPNFYFPANRLGKVRMPMNIVPLP